MEYPKRFVITATSLIDFLMFESRFQALNPKIHGDSFIVNYYRKLENKNMDFLVKTFETLRKKASQLKLEL